MAIANRCRENLNGRNLATEFREWHTWPAASIALGKRLKCKFTVFTPNVLYQKLQGMRHSNPPPAPGILMPSKGLAPFDSGKTETSVFNQNHFGFPTLQPNSGRHSFVPLKDQVMKLYEAGQVQR